MPAPTVVVVYVDADGDEFPVRVAPSTPLVAAKAEAEKLIAEGAWRPAGDLKYVRTEEG